MATARERCAAGWLHQNGAHDMPLFPNLHPKPMPDTVPVPIMAPPVIQSHRLYCRRDAGQGSCARYPPKPAANPRVVPKTTPKRIPLPMYIQPSCCSRSAVGSKTNIRFAAAHTNQNVSRNRIGSPLECGIQAPRRERSGKVTKKAPGSSNATGRGTVVVVAVTDGSGNSA